MAVDFSRIPQEGMIPPMPDPGDNGMNPPGGSMEGYDPNLYEFLEVKNIMVDGGDRFGVTAVCFDGQEELLWMGNHGGHVTSYFGLDLQKYTSFQVHESLEIRQILTVDRRVLSLTPDSLRCSSKFGRPLFQHFSESLQDMQCMIQTGPATVLMGGHQPLVVELDIESRKEIRQVQVNDPGCAILRFSNNYVCAGDTSGKVTLRDPKTLNAEHTLQAHSGTLSDFDVHGNQLVTCGFGNRMGHLAVDRFLMIYDLRFLKATSPMQMALDPMFLRFVPTYSNRLAVVSQTGQFQVMEQGALTPSSMLMYQCQTEGALVSSFDISPSNQVLACGDSGGFMHVFASGEEPVFSPYSSETEFPSIEHLETSLNVTDELAPYSIVPMMYPSSGRLLSDFPLDCMKRVYRNPQKIDAEILRSMKMVQNVGYAPNTTGRRRNQIPYKITTNRKGAQRKASVPDSPMERGEDPFVIVPKRYRKVEIKYSKLGVEDFDFRHYNKTNFAGLETHIPNAYCNSMLQLLYFVEPFRCSMLSHLCEKEFCLACELGFLFHMLDKQKGKTCQGSNFLRAFRTIPEASALGLVLNDAEESMGKANLPRLIQNWNRFILQQVHTELVEAQKAAEMPQSPLSVIPLSPLAASPKSPLINTSVAEYEAADQSTNKDLLDVKDTTLNAPNDDDKEACPPSSLSEQLEEEADDNTIQSAEGEDLPETPKVTNEGTDIVIEEPKDDEEVFEASETVKEKEEDKSDEDDDGPKSGKALPSVIKDLFGSDLANTFKCKCSNTMSREMTSSVIDLAYPDISNSSPTKGAHGPEWHFSQVVQRSVCLEQNTQAWCNRCKKYQPHLQSKILESLPEILALNCHLENQRDFEFWKTQEEFVQKREEANPTESVASMRSHIKMCRYGNQCTRKDCKFRHENDAERGNDCDMNKMTDDKIPDKAWVPVGLKMKLGSDGKVEATDIPSEELIPKSWEDEHAVYYELFATVAYVRDTKSGGNLVSHVHVGEEYHRRKEGVTCTQWYLFNDFAITPIEQQEAAYFNMEWKIPCVIYFSRSDVVKKHPVPVMNPIHSGALFHNASLVTPRMKNMTFTPLDDDEIPLEGDVIGLDAEFVTLNQEEAELRSDGTRSTIKPSQMSVARVSCVRGKGTLLGEPFIDDYISTQEQVVDYLTQFSGIKPGDLDASISSKHLTTLKATYLKLRYLIDSGVIFIGHGLKKDFRVINLVVPKDQVIDTVELFHLPRQRMISLKFLAWHFLGINIQSITHDSTEDARTAVKLYHKYQEMGTNGKDKVREGIKDLYDKGRKMQWKIPDSEDEKESNNTTNLGLLAEEIA